MNLLKEIINKSIDILYPARCLCCNVIIESIGKLCSDCFKKIDFISSNKCYICSYPFQYHITDELLCANCIKKRPIYNRAFAVFKYNENSKKLIHKFKFSDCTYLAPYLAEFMYKSIDDNDIDYIAPIPIHKFRLLKRLYNQSLLLASNISKLSKNKLIPDLLIKTKNTKPQFGLTYKKRKINVTNAFMVNDKYTKIIKNKKILLVDDVITTGATINYCSKLLFDHNVYQVNVVAIGKTIFN